jgi:[ribosomal protein S5]-alanine N-acetyltransferase
MSSAPPRAVIPRLTELNLAIETTHMKLRPVIEADVDAMWPIVSKPEFPKQMSWSAHMDREETVEFVRSRIANLVNNRGVTWAVEHEGTFVGCVGFDDLVWQLRALRLDRCELGYWLAPQVWNKGLATEAATAVVRCGFETIGLHKIKTRCFVDNHASRRVIEKVGFRFVGRAEDDVWRDGRWTTQLLYELTSPEWPDVHTTMPLSRPRPT